MAQDHDSLITQQILACLSAQGAALRELEQRLGKEISKRTLQRALNDMREAGKLERRGNGRAVRYYPLSAVTHYDSSKQNRTPFIVPSF